MAAFKEFLTIEGERLLAKVLSGKIKLSFTRMEIGDGDRGNKSRSVTSLESPKMELDIYSVKISGDSTIQITSILKSKNIETGFYFREKGIFVSDGSQEVLFLYGTAGSFASFIENSTSSVFTRTIKTLITMSEGDSTGNIVVQDGTFASGEDMDKTRDDILNAISNIQLDGDWSKYEQAEKIIDILDKFCSMYTALRASKLDKLDNIDKLDVTVSSRAAADSALSNAVWTNARAGLLDKLGYLDDYMSSRAPAATALSNAVWTNGRATAIDSINANTARITATRAGYIDYLANGTYGLPAIKNYVDTLESTLGTTADTGGTASAGTTTAKLNALITILSGGNAKVSCIKRVLHGTCKGGSSVGISPVCDLNKTIVLLNGGGHETSSHQAWATIPSYTLEEGRLYISCSTGDGYAYIDYQIIEFY